MTKGVILSNIYYKPIVIIGMCKKDKAQFDQSSIDVRWPKIFSKTLGEEATATYMF